MKIQIKILNLTFYGYCSEMKPTNPSFITGSNVINEMRPQPTQPVFSPRPSTATPARPAITFDHITR